MNDKFSLYQTDGLWGIIENTSNEKQTSIKSYFGSDLIIKRLNEQDQQIDQLKQQLDKKDKMHLLDEQEFQHYCAYKLIETEIKGCLDREKQLEQKLAELKEKAIARPKFKHFEEYWYIENNPYCDNELQVFNGKVMEIICAYDEDWLYEYRFDTSCRYIEEDNIFATEQEAQAKLKEMKGNE